MLIIFVLTILSILPIGLAGYGEVRPVFVLTAVYYWAVYRPSMLPPLGTFLSGLALDLLTGGPLGLQAFVLLAVRMLVTGQQKLLLAQQFGVVWACFGLVALAAGLVQWLVYALILWHVPVLKPVLINAALSALLFPAVVLPLFLLNRALESRDIFR